MKRINEACRLTGLSRRTLQYYDDEGILIVERSSNNHRLYDQQALERIWEILLYKEMDFELKEIKYLFKLSEEQKQEHLGKRMEEIRRKIIEENVQLEFASMIRKCGIPSPPPENSGKTYINSIKELRNQIRLKIMQGI